MSFLPAYAFLLPRTASDPQPPSPLPLAPGVPCGPASYPSVPKPLLNYATPGLLHPGSFVLDDLRRYSVDLRYTVSQTTGSVPISTVIINEASGSRTILHANRFVHLSARRQLPPPSPNPQDRTLLSEVGAQHPRDPAPFSTPAEGPGHW